MKKSMDRRSYVITLEEGQVFTADFTFEQMQAQSVRIDKARRISMTACAIAVSAFVVAIIAIIL